MIGIDIPPASFPLPERSIVHAAVAFVAASTSLACAALWLLLRRRAPDRARVAGRVAAIALATYFVAVLVNAFIPYPSRSPPHRAAPPPAST